jgi:hypothetical protein
LSLLIKAIGVEFKLNRLALAALAECRQPAARREEKAKAVPNVPSEKIARS